MNVGFGITITLHQPLEIGRVSVWPVYALLGRRLEMFKVLGSEGKTGMEHMLVLWESGFHLIQQAISSARCSSLFGRLVSGDEMFTGVSRCYLDAVHHETSWCRERAKRAEFIRSRLLSKYVFFSPARFERVETGPS